MATSVGSALDFDSTFDLDSPSSLSAESFYGLVDNGSNYSHRNPWPYYTTSCSHTVDDRYERAFKIAKMFLKKHSKSTKTSVGDFMKLVEDIASEL